MSPIRISYYSDVLCIWAYASQRRLEQLVASFGDQISIETRYCSVFPDVWGKIEDKWGKRGGFEGFGRHSLEVAQKFEHIKVNERIWLDARPRTSASPHLFLKAIEAIEADQLGPELEKQPYLERLSSRAAWAMRLKFFAQGKDIANWQVHSEIAAEIGVDYDLVEEKIRSSEALALLAIDYDLSRKNNVEGSPTFIMNEGRQKLFGNVGYRLLEANVKELLRNHSREEASWC
ncbi:DsbA-like thioredoxin domain protein [hydrothermal vent metagenome]|uniref:DsbA-like thioredoxin domain protein n=1 Tax=hydrothermal vent metagenome TaxID=652676 RepID=A0A3B0TP95_9ZZZZ